MLGHNLGLLTTGWVTQVRISEVQRPKTPDEENYFKVILMYWIWIQFFVDRLLQVYITICENCNITPTYCQDFFWVSKSGELRPFPLVGQLEGPLVMCLKCISKSISTLFFIEKYPGFVNAWWNEMENRMVWGGVHT